MWTHARTHSPTAVGSCRNRIKERLWRRREGRGRRRRRGLALLHKQNNMFCLLGSWGREGMKQRKEGVFSRSPHHMSLLASIRSLLRFFFLFFLLLRPFLLLLLLPFLLPPFPLQALTESRIFFPRQKRRRLIAPTAPVNMQTASRNFYVLCVKILPLRSSIRTTCVWAEKIDYKNAWCRRQPLRCLFVCLFVCGASNLWLWSCWLASRAAACYMRVIDLNSGLFIALFSGERKGREGRPVSGREKIIRIIINVLSHKCIRRSQMQGWQTEGWRLDRQKTDRQADTMINFTRHYIGNNILRWKMELHFWTERKEFTHTRAG